MLDFDQRFRGWETWGAIDLAGGDGTRSHSTVVIVRMARELGGWLGRCGVVVE